MKRVAAIALTSLFLTLPLGAQDDETAAPEAEVTATEAAAPAADGETATTDTVEATATDSGTESAAPADETAKTEAADAAPIDASTDMERIIVSGVAGGVAVVGLGVGITFGILSMNQYNCLADITECNKTLDEPIEGEKYLDARADVERMALYADMGYLVAATAATVAAVGAVEILLGSETEASE